MDRTDAEAEAAGVDSGIENSQLGKLYLTIKLEMHIYLPYQQSPF